MLKAILFDFNGVIADDEPIHLKMFQKVLDEEGISLPGAEYYRTYIGMDDRDCFESILLSHGREAGPQKILELVAKKARHYEAYIRDHVAFFPGVLSFIRKAAAKYPLVVVSGALRHEIEFILQQGGIRQAFRAVISAEEVSHGKPNPEGYLRALEEINRSLSQAERISAPECLVIEDTLAGIEAAHRAGMKCLAVSNSYSIPELFPHADLVAGTLEDLPLEKLEGLFDLNK
jgi:HAD superfamily hydrolase (TIGR01509 family)